MARMIFKYMLPEAVSTLRMPQGARILSVGYQEGIVLWADVDPDARGMNRVIEAENTGKPVPQGEYIGTTTSTRGVVWHLYDQGEHEPVVFSGEA